MSAFIPDQLEQMSKKDLLDFAQTAHEENVRLKREVATVKRTYNQLFDEMLKEQERNRELSQNQLLTENGKNRYGLDVSYFRNAINRELNRPLANHKPDELARVFARLSRTADESVMFEPEFSNKFALEQKVEGAFKFADFLDSHNFSAAIAAKESGFFQLAETLAEQLRKEQDND